MANGASDHQIAFILNPAASQHLLEQGFVEAAPGLVIDVLWACKIDPLGWGIGV